MCVCVCVCVCMCVCVCVHPISFFKINFPGNVNRIQFTGTCYLCQIVFHNSN